VTEGTAPQLRVRDLAVEFRSGTATIRAIDGVSFDLAPGETLGNVGESCCGKSVTSLSIMRQRVMIAMAQACNPRILIADEPTTALDVTIQAQILELIRKLRHELGMAVMLITHDLGIVAEMCERVVVMYAGRIVEEGDVLSIFTNPVHPYTAALLASMPRLDLPRGRLAAIDGAVPDPHAMPRGCRFAPRCVHVQDRCRVESPPLEAIAPGRRAACFLARDRITS